MIYFLKIRPKFSLILLLFLFSFSSYSQEGHIYTSRGYALSGYDAVAYFTQNKAIVGNKDKYFYKFGGGKLFLFQS